MALPAAVRRQIESYLSAVDEARPGLVEGLYVTGSIPLDDYRPAVSDVDLVAVSAETPSRRQLDVLSALHRPAEPNLDLLYLTWDDLAVDPGVCRLHIRWKAPSPRTGVPHIRSPGGNCRRPPSRFAGRVSPNRTCGSTPACSATGTSPTSTGTGCHGSRAGAGSGRRSRGCAASRACSATGAGQYALDVVDPRWHPVTEAAIVLRADQRAPLTRSVEALHREASEVAAWLIEDAHRRVDQLDGGSAV